MGASTAGRAVLGMVSQVAARAGARLVQAGTHPCTRPAAAPRCMQSLRAVSAARPVALPHGVVRNITFTTAAFETVGKGITLDALRLEDLEPETLRSKRSRRRRLRQHVNPLASAFQVPSELPPLDTIFADASRPLHLDIGCGRGDLVASMSTLEPGFNYLGVDVNPERIDRAATFVRRHLRRVQRGLGAEGDQVTNGEVDNTDDDTDDDGSAFPAVELGNVHVMHANISSSLLTMFGPLPPTTLRRVSLLHPDPWFKKRHYKRRVINEAFLADLASVTTAGCEIYVKSDVAEVMDDILEHFANASDKFAAAPHLKPLQVQSQREMMVRAMDKPVYGATFVRV